MDFNPFAFDWEDDSISAQIAPSEPTEVSPKTPSSEITTPGTPKKVPTSPKRKRNDVDDSKDRGTAPKRPSPLRQVHTFDALDPSTPRKDAGDAYNTTPNKSPDLASQESTPKTVVKRMAGFNIDTPDRLDVQGLIAEELDNPFSSAPPKAISSPSSIFSTSATGFTSTGFAFDPVKRLSTAGRVATPNPLPAAKINSNMAAKERDTPNKSTTSTAAKHPMNPPATPRKHTPTPPVEPLTPKKPAAKPATQTTPETPTAKPLSRLHATPQIAPHYIPEYASPSSPLKLRDPRTFTLSPPFWTRWPKTRYTRLATYIQETIDLSTFAM